MSNDGFDGCSLAVWLASSRADNANPWSKASVVQIGFMAQGEILIGLLCYFTDYFDVSPTDLDAYGALTFH